MILYNLGKYNLNLYNFSKFIHAYYFASLEIATYKIFPDVSH